MSLRPARAGLFGIIALCFLLPFAEVSCSSTESARAFVLPTGEGTTVSGFQLVTGSVRSRVDGSPAALLGGNQNDRIRDEVRAPSEPFAILALASAFAGIALCLSESRRAIQRAAIAGAVGASCLLLLARSPTLASLGLSRVEFEFGYWLTLFLFVISSAIHVILLLRPVTSRDPAEAPP